MNDNVRLIRFVQPTLSLDELKERLHKKIEDLRYQFISLSSTPNVDPSTLI